MADISTVWDPDNGRGDWVVVGADLVAGDDLATAVLISLFTDRRAEAEDVIPDGSGDPRGWWGDTGRDFPLGSKLWLLDRSKQTEDVRQRAEDYINDCLAWVLDGGIAASLTVEASWQKAGMLGARIVLFEPDGSIQREFNYQWAWKDVS